MKLKIPAEAVALGVILFSANMQEAMIAGILLLSVTVLAEVVKNILKSVVPMWSWRACVCIASAACYAGAMELAFAVTGWEMDILLWVMTGITGLLTGYHVCVRDMESDYADILYEGALTWGAWIVVGILREFLGQGTVFGNQIADLSVQSASFQKPIFGFLAAGLILAFVCAVVKKSCNNTISFFVVIPAVYYFQPYTMNTLGGIAGIVFTGTIALVLFLSVLKVLEFSNISKYFRKLPAEMLAMGLIYMILSVY